MYEILTILGVFMAANEGPCYWVNMVGAVLFTIGIGGINADY